MLLPYIILPPLQWFVIGCQQQQFPILLNAPFIKQNGANRYNIAAPNNIQPLTIPVNHEDRNRPLPEVRINYNQNWIKDHKQAWQTAYGKSPFFEYYDYRFFAVFDEQPQTMQHIIHGLNQVLFQNLKIPFAPDYITQPNATSSLNAQNALLPYHQQPINPAPYTQTFHTKFGFRESVSAIDLLFNLGPLAPEYLSQYNPPAII